MVFYMHTRISLILLLLEMKELKLYLFFILNELLMRENKG